jgi:uncharacterized protein (DUF4415 family)
MSKDKKKRVRRSDVDSPRLTDEMLARMRPAREVVPGIVAAAKRRGRPRLEHPKQAVKLRLDADVLSAFRESGSGWQTRINETLRAAVARKTKRKVKRLRPKRSRAA